MKKIGIILMTYGSATTSEHVREYMDHIYRGKASEEVVKDFEERYRLVGGSPLVRITAEQASRLEEFLNSNQSDGSDENKTSYIVRSGMLHSKPMIDEAVKYCKDAGVERCIGIILSPQFSSFIMEGYKKVFTSAALACGFLEDAIAVCGPWPTEPDFIELLTRRVVEAVARIKASDLEILRPIPVVFTTHSLPKRVVEKDPAYLDQLKRTTDAVLARLKASGMEQSVDFTYYSAYQSAGHTPEEWLKPDLTDILAGLAGQGVSKTNPSEAAGANDSVIGTKKEQVLIVPIQFLTDHLEILYDLDVAAREQCEEFGIGYNRIELPNLDPLFIRALAQISLKKI